MSADVPMAPMPYIGLRPFRREDADLFFGREDQVEGLLERLESHRFLAVVGTSGCGKSSLVRAGLVPDLENGFMAEAGEGWQFATLLPGTAPIGNLAAALVDSGALGARYASDDAAAAVAASLRRGPLGLVELLDEVPPPEGTNLLVIVDQFEEIFRFRRLGDAAEAAAFVNLLLTAAATRKHPVYVVLTMRSDYLGDCAVFPGLPEALNDAQFLVPRLNRSQLETAITGPAALFDADVDEALLNRILNELGSDPDQLPLMQHALMRMWSLEIDARDDGLARLLDLDAYVAIGGLDHALSNHVSEVSRELTFGRAPAERERLDLIVKVLFRCLCDVTSGRQDIRRPAVLSEVAAVVDADPAQVIRVVEAFRTPTCSFIMPPAGVPLREDTVLDIAHESLIRNWDELRDWRGDEARWKEEYDRLVQSARRWEQGKAALSVPPELDAQHAWHRTETIGPAWAARYGPVEDYELAVRYIEESAAAETKRRTRRRRRGFLLRWSIIGTAVLLITALTLTAQSYMTAEEERQRAEEEHGDAVKNLELAEDQRDEATRLLLERNVAEAALKAQRDKLESTLKDLGKKNDVLEKTKAALLKTETDLRTKVNDSEIDKERLREEQKASVANLRLAEGRMLAAEAAVATAGQGRDLNRAMLLALRASLELGSQDPTCNRVLDEGHQELLPVHLVRSAEADPVTAAGDLGDGSLLLITAAGVLERLDIAGGALREIGRLPPGAGHVAIHPGPGPGSAVVSAGAAAFRIHRDGGVLPLPIKGYIGVGHGSVEGRLLIWGTGDNAWMIVMGTEERAMAQGTLPCTPAGPQASALNADGTGPIVICTDGTLHGAAQDPARGPVDVGGPIRRACVAPDGGGGVTLTVEDKLTKHGFADGSAVVLNPGPQNPGVLDISCNWEEDILLGIDSRERMTIWRLSTGMRIGTHHLGGYDRGGPMPTYRNGLTAWADSHGNVHVWDWDQKRTLGEALVGTFMVSATLTGDGQARLLWVVAEDGLFRGWSVDRRPPVRRVEGPLPVPPESAAPTPEAQQWVAEMKPAEVLWGPGGEVVALRTEHYRLLLAKPQTQEVFGLGVGDTLLPAAFSADGLYFASAGVRRGIRIWDHLGRDIRSQPVHAPIRALGFSDADGSTLLYTTTGEETWEWPWKPLEGEALRLDVCSRLPVRKLDVETWHRLLGKDAKPVKLCPSLTTLRPVAGGSPPDAQEPSKGPTGPPPGMGGH